MACLVKNEWRGYVFSREILEYIAQVLLDVGRVIGIYVLLVLPCVPGASTGQVASINFAAVD